MPSTGRPAGLHFPSPFRAGWAKGTRLWGGGRWGTVPALELLALGDPACGMALGDGLPPIGGAWGEYHQFSIETTNEPPPWSRAHSAARAGRERPRAGLVRASPSETQIGVMSRITRPKRLVFG